MIFNTVFALWAIQFVANLLVLNQPGTVRYKAGCFIWVALFFLHLANAALIAPMIADYLATEEERISAQWAQSAGWDGPFVLFFAGILGSILLQVIFNAGQSRSAPLMPDTYGTGEGEENAR